MRARASATDETAGWTSTRSAPTQVDEGARDAGDQWVAGGQRDDRAVVVPLQEGGQSLTQRAGPRLAELALDRRQQLEVTGTAQDHVGSQYPLPQGFRHARPAVGADADNCEACGVEGRHED